MAHIQSMTGFGRSTTLFQGKKISCEVKSLNSKQADVNLRAPQAFRSQEAHLRKQVIESLQRGKIDVAIYVEEGETAGAPRINQKLARHYLSQFKMLETEVPLQADYLSALLRMPDILDSEDEEVDEATLEALQSCLADCLNLLQEHRQAEGEALRKDVQTHLEAIRQAAKDIEPFEKERIPKIKERLNKALSELKEQPDGNRYEQELIYYLEKLDISEEKVRLHTHLNYLEELLQEGGSVGKKLGFVAQEIGREINTMGSKANHAGMQKLVVGMKDELEKIKEQVLNIL